MYNPSSTYRTPEGQQKYLAYQRSLREDEPCVLCAKPSSRDFEHWRIVENSFPYDRIAKVHDMLLTRRHTQGDLTDEEQEEYKKIRKEVIDEEYQYLLEPTLRNKTAPAHFHIHLIVGS